MTAASDVFKKLKELNIFEFLYKWGTLITIGLLILFFSLAREQFLSPTNIINILRSISIVTVIAIGLTVSLAIGGLDLSVGSVASLSDAIVISLFVWYGWSTIGVQRTLFQPCLLHSGA